MTSIPLGHPPIPDGLRIEDVVAIVTVHDPEAPDANRATPFKKSSVNTKRANGQSRRKIEGSHVFLHHIYRHYCYALGRGDSSNASGGAGACDVYFPSTQDSMNQLVLIPIWESNCWRLQSVTETMTTVNGASIQYATDQIKQFRKPLPSAVHLRQDTVNLVKVNRLSVDIWLLKTVRELYPTEQFPPTRLRAYLQDVSLRPEPWARDQYLMSRERVSARSHRVVERFTGEVQTAKSFQQQDVGRQLRDKEFLRLAKGKVDESIVQYLQSVEIDNIPAIITSTHEGLVPYAELRNEIKSMHPGDRFYLAAKLLRRLMFALQFFHFHGIVHGTVSHESVLLRLLNHRDASVLLVDYTNTTSFPMGAPFPHKEMIEDGRAAMQIVDDCCDIWQLRKAATKDAFGEAFMRKKTDTAREEFDSVQRVVADFLGPKGGTRNSEAGKKLLRLLEMKETSWQSAQVDQIHNATRREIGTCYMSSIDAMVEHWAEEHPSPPVSRPQYMILTLGHEYLDGLGSQLYLGRWDLTPQEVCAKYKELVGDIEDPWQTYEVIKQVTFRRIRGIGFDERDVLDWLASCCETHPEWRPVIELKLKNIQAQYSTILDIDIETLRDALLTHGALPPFILATFERLMSDEAIHQELLRVSETHHISVHMPSRMFNLTQLQYLATPAQLSLCVNEERVKCDNYVEVRGEPKIQGCYAPISLLPAFVAQLGVSLSGISNLKYSFPTYDPSDFSQVSSARVVLAHTGLLAFASVSRTGNQFNFHAPKFAKTFETINTFLPTYFGNMKVLPRIQEGADLSNTYHRPDHWSKFETAEALEAAAKVGPRKVLKPGGPLEKSSYKPDPTILPTMAPLSMDIDLDEPALAQILKERKLVRAAALPPTKRSRDSELPNRASPFAKRHESIGQPSTPPRKVNDISMSFVNRAAENLARMAENFPNELSSSPLPRIPDISLYRREGGVNQNLLSNPPRMPFDHSRSFTIAAGSFDLEEDWKQVEQWVKYMPIEDDYSEVEGLQEMFGFVFQPSPEDNRRKRGSSKGRSIGTSYKTEATEVATPTFSAGTSSHHSESEGKGTPTPTPSRNGKGKAKVMTPLASFAPHLLGPGLATPEPSSPFVRHPNPFNVPGDSFSIRDNAGVSLSSSSAQPETSSPLPPALYAPIQPTQSLGFINKWLDQARAAQDEDEDMPDTDVESVGGESMGWFHDED